MASFLSKTLASLSLWLRQPLWSFCDIETADGPALVTKHGDYVTWLRIDGMRRLCNRADVARIAEAMRIDLSSAFESRGRGLYAAYISDPDRSAVEIDRINLQDCREAARQQGLDLSSILDERARLWPRKMRWEEAYFVLWTRRSILNKEERKQVQEEQNAAARAHGVIGDSQRLYLRSGILATRQSAFVARVVSSLRTHDIASIEMSPREALAVTREVLYRETAGSPWRARLPGDRVMPRPREDGSTAPSNEGSLTPSLRRQMFNLDAETHGGQRVQIGDLEYVHVDMDIGPEEPRPFIELAAPLGGDRVPWRAGLLVEGGTSLAMNVKAGFAEAAGVFPGNADLRRGFDALAQERATNNHASVQLRASFATWAPAGQAHLLRSRKGILTERVQGWGNTAATSVCGDPLEGVLSSVPGLALASTGTPNQALLGEVLSMLPWNRPASPWSHGSVLFRRPDGSMSPYDPSGGSKRPQVLDIFVAPPRSGKSVLANTINLGLCLSSAVLGSKGAKLPLIGKADIGASAEGFVILLQEALGPERRHEAIFVTMQFAPGYEVNVFDLQTGCDAPLPLERVFLENFLALATLPPNTTTPFEGMNQLITLVIDEAYRLCTETRDGAPKRYRRGIEPAVDAALVQHAIDLHAEDPLWRDVVSALCACGEWRLAGTAQRHAVPILEDLVAAVRTDHVKDRFANLKLEATHEHLGEIFERYIYHLIARFPTLNAPTKLDFGPARVIILDLAAIAPTGSADANRQTEMVYLLARHILARNFFLIPGYADYVPERVRDYHRTRFQEVYESVKRLDFDEWHRTEGSPQVRAQAERDMREGPKHNVQLGFASQRLQDMGPAIISQSTGRFILKAGDEAEAREIIERFNLSEATAAILRTRLGGPGPEGAPFIAILSADDVRYEQFLYNQLGPIELWALSTTPGDTALRRRLYEKLGFSEALRRLARIFQHGSAMTEIEARKDVRLRRGEMDATAEEGVIDEIASEITDARGIGMPLRSPLDADPRDAEPPPLALAAE